MIDLKNGLTTSGKGSTNIQARRIKGFGYQVLGFGSGGGGGPVEMDYLLIGSGGGGQPWPGGGAGSGGYRTSFPGGTQLPVEDGAVITIGVGSPGTAGQMRGALTSVGAFEAAGGGSGGGPTTGDAPLSPSPIWYQDGGCGGGGGHNQNSAARVPAVPAPWWGMGNLPASSGDVNPIQGYNGMAPKDTPSGPSPAGSGGGGAGGGGNRNLGQSPGGPGGAGTANSITGSPVTRGGGGGGGVYHPGPGGSGGSGGGGAGGPRGASGSPGGANQGGGGGGGSAPSATGGTGGTGVVFLRVPSATAPATLSVTPGTNSVSTLGPGDKLCTFTVSGTVVF